LKDSFVDFVDKGNRVLQIFLNRVLGDNFGILYLFVINEGALEINPPFTNLDLPIQRQISLSEVFFGLVLDDFLTEVEIVKYFRNPPHFRQGHKNMSICVTKNVNNQAGMHFLDRLP
jgi:hypothetical protein